MRYPASLEQAEEGGFVVTFRDIPEAITQAATETEAMEMARDALITAMDFYFEDRRAVPAPSQAEAGEKLIDLPPSISAKVFLLNELIRQKISNAELARRLGTSPQTVNRLTTLTHPTKIDALAEVFAALGKRLDVVVS